MADPRKPSRSSHAGDLAGSDFLFHLYRGAEYLQDNQVHEAKSEIENAMRLQPKEPQGQDLLAQVYFRLGLYPRAIAIYETLTDTFPEETAPRMNLALCFLKTGQPERARDQLEKVVTLDRSKDKAWGYLGLAFERVGDYEKARVAFENAGHRSMALRMAALMQPDTASEPPSAEVPDLTELRCVAEAAFHELDATDDAFSLALPNPGGELHESAAWFAVELGQAAKATKTADVPRRTAPVSRVPIRSHDASVELPGESNYEPVPASAEVAPVWSSKRVELFARESTLVFPREGRAARHSGGSVLLSLVGDFAARLDLVHAMTSGGQLVADGQVMRRGDVGQTVLFGESTRPLSVIGGARQLVLRPQRNHSIHVVELAEQHLYVREACVGGFDTTVVFDHGRLPSGHGDTISLVHLHGTGAVVLELPEGFVGIETSDATGCVIRCASMLGWFGRIQSRCLPAADAPALGRGWSAFSGEGTVLFDPTRETEF